MALIVSDTFTEASDTSLTSHTPDTGTGWTEEADTGTGDAQIVGADDNLRRDTGENNVHAAYSAQPNPSVAEYDVEFTVTTAFSGSGTRIVFAFGRFTDTSDAGYAIQLINGTSGAQKLLKRASGSTTVLDSNATVTSDGDKFKLEIRDAAKKVYKDSGGGWVEILTSADDVITSNGKAGLGWGDLYEGGHIVTNWRLDDFKVTEVSTDPTPSVSESITVSESVTASLDDLGVNVSESITVSESVTASLDDLGVSAAESITLAETVEPELASLILVSDSVTVAETVALAIVDQPDRAVSVSESITVSESVTVTREGGATLPALDEGLLTGGLQPLGL